MPAMSGRQTLSVALSREPAVITVRREVDGASIAASARAALRPVLERWLDAFAAARADWTPGFAIDTGWCALSLRTADGGFAVECPDFSGDPHVDSSTDLTVPMTVSAGWDGVRRAARIEPTPIRFDDSVTAVVGWERCTRLTMTRDPEPAAGDSGWLIEPHESEPGEWRIEQRERLEAWMVQRLKPAAIRAAVLPSAFAAVLELDAIRVVVDRGDRSVRSHGLL